MRAKLSIALSALAAMVWAVPNAGAAHFVLQSPWLIVRIPDTFDPRRRLIEFVTSANN